MLLACATLFLAPATVRANGIRPGTPLPAPKKLDFGFAGGVVSFGSKTGTGFLSDDPARTKKTTTKGKPSTLTLIASLPNGKSFTGSNLGRVLFTTGFAEPGATNNLITYAPGGSITITSSKKLGTGPHAVPSGSILFSGFFTGLQSFVITKGKCKNCFTGLLNGDTKATFVSPNLLALLGLPPVVNGVFNSIEFDLSLKLQGASLHSGTLVVTPEPGTLTLAGTGLLSLAGLIRRRKTIAAIATRLS